MEFTQLAKEPLFGVCKQDVPPILSRELQDPSENQNNRFSQNSAHLWLFCKLSNTIHTYLLIDRTLTLLMFWGWVLTVFKHLKRVHVTNGCRQVNNLFVQNDIVLCPCSGQPWAKVGNYKIQNSWIYTKPHLYTLLPYKNAISLDNLYQ